jgi:hypothetical protein
VTDAIHNLNQAVAQWREEKEKTYAPRAEQHKSPYGAKIQAENIRWHERKKALETQIEDERLQYRANVGELQRLHERWLAEGNEIAKTPRGPKPKPHSDAVKIAAALALREGAGKTKIRAALGISKTTLLDELLREGEELLQVEELKARDQKQDQATGEEW